MKRLCTLLLSIVFLLQSIAPKMALAEDSFDRGEIETAMKDFYDHYSGRNTGDSQFLGTDRDRLTRVMARQLITLEPNLFNDIIGHMVAVDYRQSPDDREAIEKLTAAIETEGRGTVFNTEKAAKEKSAMTVLADTVAVWSVACLSIGFARSWAAADDEMTGFEKFAFVMKNTPEQMPKDLRSKIAIAGLGLAVGSSHAAYDYLYQTRLEPMDALKQVQVQVVQELAEKADSYHGSLQKDLSSKKRISQSELQADRTQLGSLEEQVLQMTKDDAQFEGRLSPVAEDIASSKGLIEKLLAETN